MNNVKFMCSLIGWLRFESVQKHKIEEKRDYNVVSTLIWNPPVVVDFSILLCNVSKFWFSKISFREKGQNPVIHLKTSILPSQQKSLKEKCFMWLELHGRIHVSGQKKNETPIRSLLFKTAIYILFISDGNDEIMIWACSKEEYKGNRVLSCLSKRMSYWGNMALWLDETCVVSIARNESKSASARVRWLGKSHTKPRSKFT